MSTAVSTPASSPSTAAGAPELDAVERGIELALTSDWACRGLLALSEMVVSEMVAAGFARGPKGSRPSLLTSDWTTEAFVLGTAVDSESGQALTVRTSLRCQKRPGSVGETLVLCSVFRPGPLDSAQERNVALLGGKGFERTAPMLSTQPPDWFLPAEERNPDTGLDQAILSHMRALKVVTDPELARPKAAELTRELLAVLSP